LIAVEDQFALSEQTGGSVWWLSVTFASFWAGLLAHEGAHFAAFLGARVVGLRSGIGSALVPAAGPLMTLLIVAGCALLVVRSRRVVMTRTAFLTAMGAASRLVLVAVPTMQGKSNDEHDIMLAIGWSAGVIWTVEAALTTLLLVWMVRRSGAHLRSGQVGMMLLGILAGWFSAFTLGRAIGLRI
jgi:hypothetical protein